MKITVQHERFPFARPFTISRGTRTHQDVVTVTLYEGNRCASAECTPYPRYGESVESVIRQIEQISAGGHNLTLNRQQLQSLLPAGAARNALDCALWRLEWQSQFPSPAFEIAPAIPTAMTVSIDTADVMARQAAELAANGATLLKIKLDAEAVIERVSAIRKAVPDIPLILDANEAWGDLPLSPLFDALAPLDIKMIEQPVPAEQASQLKGIPHPIPLCADESCHTSQDIAALTGCFEMVNIKLDKTGGLTEALKLEQTARAAGFDIMVGCMVGTSLAMEMALPLASRASIVDLDGPVLLGYDRPRGLRYQNGMILTGPMNTD